LKKGRRVLAEDDDLVFEETQTNTDSLEIGDDGLLDETELADVTEIDQTDNTEQLNAVDAVSDADSGTVGPNSDVDAVEDEGTSFMTWLMIVGGVLLVLALCAGGVYMMKSKNDDSFTQQQTEVDLPQMHAQSRNNMQ
jgi:hypothetical protein